MLTVLCLIFVAVTMFFRVNDLRGKKGVVWRIRMIGLGVTGVAAISKILYDWMLMRYDFTSSDVALFAGLVMVFSTSPHLPPYWKWITGRLHAEDGTA